MKLHGRLTRYYYNRELPLIALYLQEIGNWVLATKDPQTNVVVRESKQHYPTEAAALHALSIHSFEYTSGFGRPPELTPVLVEPGAWLNRAEEEGLAELYGYLDNDGYEQGYD